jgi:hypothetical protein
MNVARASIVWGILAATVGWSWSASAQHQSAAAAMQEQKPDARPINVEVRGKKKSPRHTQTHQFTTTRFWRLDAGEQAGSLWYETRIKKDGVSGNNTHLWQIEHQIGIVKGLQLDTYIGYAYDKTEGPRIDGLALCTHSRKSTPSMSSMVKNHPAGAETSS